jgi:Zn-dependent protease
MRHDDSNSDQSHEHRLLFRLLVVVLFLLPFVILFLTPVGRMWGMSSLWFFLLLICNLILLFWLLRVAAGERALPKPRMILPHEQPEIIREVMDVCVATHEDEISIFRGPLRESPASAFEKLKTAFPEQVTLLQEDERLGTALVLMPKTRHEARVDKPSRHALHWFLFFATLVTTTWAGAMYQQVDLLREPGRFMVGLPYAVGLLTILGCHELGHYFAARFHKMNVTPPFFIPVPFALGTFGAFIRMRSPPEERTSLFDMAVAGPLAGLFVAVPALLIGLQYSTIVPGPIVETPMYWLFGNVPTRSLLFGLLAKFSLPEIGTGDLLQLSPLAFAGWLGLIITALNLLPIGQLDGGHVARSMFGTKIGEGISRVAMWILILLAVFVWQGLLLWAIIVFFIARRVTPPLNDLTPIPHNRRWIGYLSFVILAAILLPFPQALWAMLDRLI